MKRAKYICIVTLLVALSLTFLNIPAHAADLTTKYRVYQNDNLLSEFTGDKEAIAYARKYANSYVEEIGSRKWIYHDFPRYQVYQLNIYLGTFKTLEEAKKEARRWAYSTIRDIHTKGWVWNNYPKYQLYQGDTSLSHWKFSDLESAQIEAKKWAGAHIIDLNNNAWVWDNMSSDKKEDLRDRADRYQVYQLDSTKDEWSFAYIEDAIEEALKWEHSYIINTNSNKKVYSNEYKYKVFQYSKFLMEFHNIDEAIKYALRWSHSTVTTATDREIWTNHPYYQVHEDNKKHVGFETIEAALDYALKQPKAWIKTTRNQIIWDNSTRLMYWAWTGSATDTTIKSQVADTSGLDVISPTWFKLLDAQGNVEDKSSPELVKWLKNQKIQIHPLIHNQFNSKLTTQFFSSETAQKKFIETIVNRSAQLGLDGINIDFESMAGSDRTAYTNFIKMFTEAAHKKGLKISIDLPRGSLAWNHLTAFDHVALAKIVDYVVTMTYDHHYSGSSSPGSVAGMQWTEQGIIEFLFYGIPRDKLIMGIPFYIREWKLDSSGKLVSNRALLSRNVKALLADKKVTSTWDPLFDQYKMEYKENGFTYVFWLEDENTVKTRLDIAKKYNLAGISAWRLGQEDPDFWQFMLLEK